MKRERYLNNEWTAHHIKYKDLYSRLRFKHKLVVQVLFCFKMQFLFFFSSIVIYFYWLNTSGQILLISQKNTKTKTFFSHLLSGPVCHKSKPRELCHVPEWLPGSWNGVFLCVLLQRKNKQEFPCIPSLKSMTGAFGSPPQKRPHRQKLTVGHIDVSGDI